MASTTTATIGNTLYHLGDPDVIVLDQIQVGEVILPMGVEPGGDEDHLRLKGLQFGQPAFGNGAAEFGAAAAGGQRHFDQMAGDGLRVAIRVERMLEGGADHHPAIVEKDVLCTVAVVDVEIDDGHALKAVLFDGVGGADGNVVEQAESHGTAIFGMMPRRAHVAEGIAHLAFDHQIGGEHVRARGPQGGIDAVRIQAGVAVDVQQTRARGRGDEFLDVTAIVHARQLFNGGLWRLVVMQKMEHAGRVQAVFDGMHAGRALRMPGNHFVLQAVVMSDVSRHIDRTQHAFSAEPGQRVFDALHRYNDPGGKHET